MTLEDVAKIVGVSRQTIQRYESGVISNIPSDKIEKLADIYHKSPTDLMGWQKSEGNADMFRIVTPPKQDPPDLTRFLQQSEIMFDGDTYNLNDADREKIRAALRLAFWDAKKQNKRKKD